MEHIPIIFLACFLAFIVIISLITHHDQSIRNEKTYADQRATIINADCKLLKSTGDYKKYYVAEQNTIIKANQKLFEFYEEKTKLCERK